MNRPLQRRRRYVVGVDPDSLPPAGEFARPECGLCLRGLHEECWGCGCRCDADDDELEAVVTNWPTLPEDRNQAWQSELATVANTTSRLAGRVTEYPGGGIPAHKLREATRLIDEARHWLAEDSHQQEELAR